MGYKVIINSVPYKKEEVKQLLIRELNCSEKEVFKYTSVNPIEIASYESLAEAKQLKEKLEDLGVYVEIQDSITQTSVRENIVESGSSDNISKDENIFSIGKILKVIGVFTWVVGCISGLISISSMGVMIGIILIVCSIVSGAIIYGLGEIVDTLQSIDNKLK